MIELGREGLVVGHHEGGAVGGLDHLGGGVGFAGPSNAEQDLMLFAIEDATGERFDGPRLIALRLVVA